MLFYLRFSKVSFLSESNESLERNESIDAGEANETIGIDESSPSGKKSVYPCSS